MFKKTHLALLSYLVVCIVWGSTYLAIRVGVTDMPFLVFAGIRFTAAGILILTASKIKGWAFPKTKKEYGILILVGLLLLFISNGLICWAEQWLESGLTALLIATLPLFMASIEFMLPHGQRPGWLGWAGLLIGFGGVAYLVSPQISLEGHTFPAMLAVIGASLTWSVGSIFLRRQTIKGAMMPIVGIQKLTAGIAFFLAAALSGDYSLSGASAKGFIALLYLIFFGSILAYTAYNYMIKEIPAAKAGTYAYINPVVAVALGALILQEVITFQNILAAVIILGGVILVQVSRISQARPGPGPEPAGKSTSAGS
ncbi:MAG: EamA family transporter [Bacillota bacterium]